jgi:endonuclease YncB( thermonuclease family)
MAPKPLSKIVPEPFGGQAVVLGVIDGDSIKLELDRGFFDYKRKTARLYGINTPETGIHAEHVPSDKEKADGKKAMAFLASILPVGTQVRFRSHAKGGEDKYGRLLLEIYVGNDKKGWANVNMMMVESGNAFEYYGTGEKPIGDAPPKP